MSETLRRAGQKWGRVHAGTRPRKWDQLEMVRADTARRLSGDPSLQVIEALDARLTEGGRTYARAISVGCGMAKPEIALVARGVVGELDLYEISEGSVEQGRAFAERRGVADRVRFHVGDVFEMLEAAPAYDLVYWKHALHHMPDVDAAVSFSRAILREGGWLSALEYCGPDLFQYDEGFLDAAREVYGRVPARLKANPKRPPRPDGTRPSIGRIELVDPEVLRADDPTESTDSAAIVPAIRRHFPGAEIRNLGGMLAHAILHRIAPNFDEESDEDRAVIAMVLEAEARMIERGVCHFCHALAPKG